MANQDFRIKNGLQVGLGASVVGIVTAESFSGSAVGLTSVPSASLTGTISSERLSGTYNIDITGTVSGDSINVGAGNTGVFANSDGTLLVTGIATFKDRVIFDSTNSIQIPVGTTEERGFRLLQTKDGSIGIGSDRITGINTSGIEQDQYILGPSGVLRSGTQVNSVGIGSIGIGLTALAGVTDGEFKFGTIDVVTGQIRYNSELSSFEGYGPGNTWCSLGGIKDVDQDTYIIAESSAGADEDKLTFYTAGTEKVGINSLGNVGIGSIQPTAKLDVNGSIAIKNHSIVSITTSHTASAGIPFTIDTFATSANDLAEYTIYVENGSNIQAQKVLVMQDGTTAYSQEYAVMYNPSKIVTIEASISGSNVLLQATPETGISGITNYKIVRGGLS